MSGHYCRCGSALAHDNAGRLCASCQARRRRDRAPEVPSEFWQTEVMVDALASGDVGRVIRAYRWHPFHGERLSQTLVAGWLHMSQAAVCRIEGGRRRVTIDEIAHIAHVLGMPVVAVRWTPQQSGEDVDPLSRRSLLGVGVGAAMGHSATTAPAAAREIDPGLVEHWTKLLRMLDRHSGAFGSHEALGVVWRELDLINEHREIARGELRAQLQRVEARWTEFASWLSNDVGDLAHRDYWGNRALRLAGEADYPDMVAWLLLRQSQWAVEQLDAHQATACAQGAGRTRGATRHMRGLVALREAHGHALATDVASCERGLAAAYDLLNADVAEPPELGRRYANPAYVTAAEARCWLELRPHKAIAMLEDALRRWPCERTRRRGTEQARLALAYAAANEPERAAAEGIKALKIARTTKSDGSMRELRRLDDRLVACDAPAARDFREAFHARRTAR